MKLLLLFVILVLSAPLCRAALECLERPLIDGEADFGELIAQCNGRKDFNSFCLSECEFYNFCPDFDACPYPGIPIGCWNTSQVTNMASAFYKYGKDCGTDFNEPLDLWDTSQVTDMNDLFFRARSFNQPIESWDTSNVRNMNAMFYLARSFNQPLESWDVGSVTDMSDIFRNTVSFDQPLANWNVSSVTNFGKMFGTSNFDGDPTVVPFNHPIDSWDTSSATDMGGMFLNNIFFNQPLDAWDISNVDSMVGMFNGARKFNQCLSTWAAKAAGGARVARTQLSEFIDFIDDPNPSIFFESGCPQNSQEGVTVPGEGPWCQSEEDGCFAPAPTDEPETNSCEEDPEATFQNGKKERTCKWLSKKLKKNPTDKSKKNTRKKCNKKSDGQKVFDICPVTCGRVGRGDCDFLEGA